MNIRTKGTVLVIAVVAIVLCSCRTNVVPSLMVYYSKEDDTLLTFHGDGYGDFTSEEVVDRWRFNVYAGTWDRENDTIICETKYRKWSDGDTAIISQPNWRLRLPEIYIIRGDYLDKVVPVTYTSLTGKYKYIHLEPKIYKKLYKRVL